MTQPSPMIGAVCFDLDDTLYPQAKWLDGAWAAVAARAANDGVDELAMRAALDRVAAEGSDCGRIIDRALAALGFGDLFSAIVWSDEHGRDRRKPDPLPFRTAVDLLGVVAQSVVYVGDRPAKDVEGPPVPVSSRSG